MKKHSPAFTLVEVLVVAPLIILFIGAFIGLVVTLTGDSLKLRESNAAAFGVQDALDEMGTASGNALGFLTTTGPLVAPQGSGNNTTAFTNENSGQANTLIISSAATTKNPYDASRQLVYTGSSPCSSSNPVYSYTTVYFISGSSLYKRTILPASPAPCTTPWQKPSCEESRVASNPAVCKASDEKLLDNVAGMTITYYDSASSTSSIPASQAEDAVSVSIQLEASKSVAGETVNYSGSSRVKRGEGGIQSSSDNRLATGAFFSCGLKNGNAYCWGRNQYGQLGNGTANDSNTPVAVSTSGVLNGKTITAIDATSDHVCAVADGNAYCWGRNQYGQLGNGTANDSNTPVAVSTSGVLNGKTITHISVGTEHSCAIADEKLYCWGANAYGTFGNGFGGGSSSTTPVAAATGNSLLTNKIISNVNLGGIHTCVVAEQRGYCWGGNYNGQLGINQTGNSQHVPNAVYTAGVLSDKNVDQVSSGSGNHTCAVAEGLAYCWGKNGDSGTGTSGQLGDGTSTGKIVPVAVTASGVLNGKTVTDISASSINSCAVASGKAYCWGSNSEGQIGNGNTTNQYNPAAVVDTGALSGKRVTEVSVGPWLSCAIASGSFYCWGLGTNGQLGNGTALSSNVPVAVSQGAMP